MMNRYQFGIIAVSETWLKDNKTQLEYVQISGYSQYGVSTSKNIGHSKYVKT